MGVLRVIRNYFCYCGIEKEEYNSVKKDAYKSNFKVWRLLNFLMLDMFGSLSIGSLFSGLLMTNQIFYIAGFAYSLFTVLMFFILDEDSIVAQLLMYFSISMMFLFACLITQNKPDMPATTFIVFLLIAPLFMIDKPYFMTIELIVASTVFLVWMYIVKPYEIWQFDFANVVAYTAVGIFIHIIANSIRIKEFVLAREVRIQKDTDEMTGLMSKSAMRREINEFIDDPSTGEGLMFLLDANEFKQINDAYGHDIGDAVISELGAFLGNMFSEDDIVARWGGDEFVVFLKGVSDTATAEEIATRISEEVPRNVTVPGSGKGVDVSIGIAVYDGHAANYSDVFKKADIAMYDAKRNSSAHFAICS